MEIYIVFVKAKKSVLCFILYPTISCPQEGQTHPQVTDTHNMWWESCWDPHTNMSKKEYHKWRHKQLTTGRVSYVVRFLFFEWKQTGVKLYG